MSDLPTPVEPIKPESAAPTGSALEPTQQAPHLQEAIPPATVAPSLSLHPGARPVPEYELVAKLGSGGFGEVWKAKGPGGFHVALKIVQLQENEGVDAELRSLELMKEIRHPNVLAPFGAWHRDDHVIVGMELGDRTLLDRLSEAKKSGQAGIPRAELLEYLRDGARGIDHLNSLGIQHRDVKPQNFLLVGGGLKVADFGLAKLLQHNVTHHSGGMTPAYAAPEFLKGKTTSQSDQYSLAVTYCQLRGGRLPFRGDQANVMLGHLADAPDLSMLPASERPIVERALAKKPEERWPSCRAFVDALAAMPEEPLPSSNVVVVEPVPTVEVPPTRVGAPVAASTAIADWPRPAPPPGIVFVGVFLLLAACPMLLLLPVWHSPAADAHATGGENGDAVVGLPPTVVNSLDMELVRIAPGTFRMGAESSTGRVDETPTHEVRITRPYFLGKQEVTQAQFERLMGTNPAHFTSERGGGPDFPVESVTWNEADEFCRRLSALPEEKAAGRHYRLPTEAEWEFACRAGTSTAFACGESLVGATANFDCTFPTGDAAPSDASPQRTLAVGSFPPNPWGLCDMHGNVWEWCADWSAPYPDDGSPRVNPLGPNQGSGKILRGGGWCSYGWLCRSAARFSMAPARRAKDIGFRVAMTIDRP